VQAALLDHYTPHKNKLEIQASVASNLSGEAKFMKGVFEYGGECLSGMDTSLLSDAAAESQQKMTYSPT